MIDIKKIGLFVDHKLGGIPLDYLQNTISSQNIETVLLHWDSPQQNDIDLIIAMGGDGTVLYVLGQFPNCPVLAINYGNVGFLTAGNKEELEIILKKLLDSDYFISERFILECRFREKVTHAVNEVVIKGITRLVVIDCFINGDHVRQIRGDGIIVGTPTGSTAYLSSTGSPIVMPEARCMIFAGLNEYNFTSRHLVLNHDAEIRLAISPITKEEDIYLCIDGKSKIPLNVNDELFIKESDRRIKLIFPNEHYFFNNLASRLSW